MLKAHWKSLKVLLVLSLLAAAIGCGVDAGETIASAAHGPAGTGGVGGTGGQGVAMTGGGGAGGATPTELSASFGFGPLHARGNYPSDGFLGIGFFTKSPFPADTRSMTYYADIPLGACQDFAVPVDSSDSKTYLDAGPSVALVGPKGTLTLDRQENGTETTYQSVLAGGLELFVPHGSYSFQVTASADVPAFQLSLTTEEDLVVTQPALPENAPWYWNRSEDLDITWTGGSDDGYPVIVQLMQTRDNVTTNVVCRFTDNGHATVPASMLQKFQADECSGMICTSPGDAGFSVGKYQWSVFDVPGFAAPVQAIMNVTWISSLAFE